MNTHNTQVTIWLDRDAHRLQLVVRDPLPTRRLIIDRRQYPVIYEYFAAVVNEAADEADDEAGAPDAV